MAPRLIKAFPNTDLMSQFCLRQCRAVRGNRHGEEKPDTEYIYKKLFLEMKWLGKEHRTLRD